MNLENRLHRRRNRLARRRSAMPTRHRPLLERLEDRHLLAISTLALGASNDVVFNGDAAADAVTFWANSSGQLQHSLGGIGGFNSNLDLDSTTPGDQTRLVSDLTSLTYNDLGKNDTVTFGISGSSPFAFNAANVSVDAGSINVHFNTSLSFDSGALNLTAERNILLKSGSSLTTVDGDITLSANASGLATGNFKGIWGNGSGTTIETTGTGNIRLTGTGGDAASSNYGVHLEGSSDVRSSLAGPSAGTITIDGTGGAGTLNNTGVGMNGIGTTITSADGAIFITGRGGGDGSGDSNDGINVQDIEISSTGAGPDAATITIDGTGGTGVGRNKGVAFLAGTIVSAKGAISITGQGGSGSGWNNDGVRLAAGSISSTGTGSGAATITVLGTAGSSARGAGVDLFSQQFTSTDGAISITGQGNSANGQITAMWVNKVQIASIGTGPDAATIALRGIGGDGGTLSQDGIKIRGASTAITSFDGDISVIGEGSTGNFSVGLTLSDFDKIASTGTGPGAAKISIEGTSRTATLGGGLLFSGSGGAPRLITSADGEISIFGQSMNNTGLTGDSSNLRITSTGSGPNAANILISGTSMTNAGISLSGASSDIATIDGDILLTGTGTTDLAIAIPIGGPAATGDITLRANTLSLSGAASVQSTGALTIVPRTASTTLGLGGAAGELNLDDAELARLVDGFSSITLGDTTAGSG